MLACDEVIAHKKFRGTVAIDEMYMGRNNKSGHAYQGKIIYLGERESGKVIIKIIKNASSREIIRVIQKYVDKNAVTDSFKSYSCLEWAIHIFK